jgi:hypothetical protein
MICLNFGKGNVHKKFLSNCEFHENWHSESHIRLMNVNKFTSTFPTFVVLFGWNRCKWSEHNAVECSWVMWKLVSGRWNFYMGINESTCMHVPTFSAPSPYLVTPPVFIIWPRHFINTIMALTVTASMGYAYSAFEKHFVGFTTHARARARAHTHTHTHTHKHVLMHRNSHSLTCRSGRRILID